MIIVYYPHGTWRIISFPKEDLEGDQRAVCGKILRGRGLDGENLLGQVMTGSPRSFRMIINHLEVGESRIMVWYWRRQWHPTPVLLPGKSHGWRSLVGCSPWCHEESDMTKHLPFHFSLSCIGEGNGNPLPCLAWRIPGTGESGGLPSMGSHRVRHN